MIGLSWVRTAAARPATPAERSFSAMPVPGWAAIDEDRRGLRGCRRIASPWPTSRTSTLNPLAGASPAARPPGQSPGMSSAATRDQGHPGRATGAFRAPRQPPQAAQRQRGRSEQQGVGGGDPSGPLKVRSSRPIAARRTRRRPGRCMPAGASRRASERRERQAGHLAGAGRRACRATSPARLPAARAGWPAARRARRCRSGETSEGAVAIVAATVSAAPSLSARRPAPRFRAERSQPGPDRRGEQEDADDRGEAQLPARIGAGPRVESQGGGGGEQERVGP